MQLKSNLATKNNKYTEYDEEEEGEEDDGINEDDGWGDDWGAPATKKPDNMKDLDNFDYDNTNLNKLSDD